MGNRTVVPQKHKTSQTCSMKHLKTHFLWIEQWSQDSNESQETPYLAHVRSRAPFEEGALRAWMGGGGPWWPVGLGVWAARSADLPEVGGLLGCPSQGRGGGGGGGTDAQDPLHLIR